MTGEVGLGTRLDLSLPARFVLGASDGLLLGRQAPRLVLRASLLFLGACSRLAQCDPASLFLRPQALLVVTSTRLLARLLVGTGPCLLLGAGASLCLGLP